jgi:anthranilate synthase component 1
MASGAFGYVGYDMIQHVEPVTITKPAALNVPEALLVIPKVVIVFDHIYQELLLIGRIENGNDDEINRQLDEIEQQLQSLPVLPPADQSAEPVELTSNTSKERYFEIVDQCRDYIKAGDIFQVVPSQRFSTPFNKNRSASIVPSGD